MGWIESHKPAAAASVHLVLAGGLWTVVGAGLAITGGRWLWQAPGTASSWLAVAAIVVGLAKGRWVLDRAARRIVERIRDRGDDRCVGGFLSLRSWMLVVTMIVAGRVLRGSHVARYLVGALYLAVGTGLMMSSRIMWRAWRAIRAGSREQLEQR